MLNSKNPYVIKDGVIIAIVVMIVRNLLRFKLWNLDFFKTSHWIMNSMYLFTDDITFNKRKDRKIRTTSNIPVESIKKINLIWHYIR